MAHEQLADHCLELLQPLGSARKRRMFGGQGLYVDDLFIAIIAFDRLFLKTDARTRAAFEAAGCEPFVYEGAGKQVTVSYWTVPAEAMESPEQMRPWACLAMEAALRARASKPSSGRPKARATPPAAKATARRPRTSSGR
jgi:DNA transformation protein